MSDPKKRLEEILKKSIKHGSIVHLEESISLRDYFVASIDVPKDIGMGWAEALAGRAKPTENNLHLEWIKFWADVDAAYRGIYADAMIAERAK